MRANFVQADSGWICPLAGISVPDRMKSKTNADFTGDKPNRLIETVDEMFVDQDQNENEI